jgi:hypothetical protein
MDWGVENRIAAAAGLIQSRRKDDNTFNETDARPVSETHPRQPIFPQKK